MITFEGDNHSLSFKNSLTTVDYAKDILRWDTLYLLQVVHWSQAESLALLIKSKVTRKEISMSRDTRISIMERQFRTGWDTVLTQH